MYALTSTTSGGEYSGWRWRREVSVSAVAMKQTVLLLMRISFAAHITIGMSVELDHLDGFSAVDDEGQARHRRIIVRIKS